MIRGGISSILRFQNVRYGTFLDYKLRSPHASRGNFVFIKNDNNVAVFKVNVDDEPELSARFGIASIPTLIFFKNGETLKKTVGYREKDELEETMKEFL